jgi:hypothetical protein
MISTTRQELHPETEKHDLRMASDTPNDEEKQHGGGDETSTTFTGIALHNTTQNPKKRAPSLPPAAMPQRVKYKDRSSEMSSAMPPIVAAPAVASLAASGALMPLPSPTSSTQTVPVAAVLDGASTMTQQAPSALPLRLPQNNEALIPHSNEQFSRMDHRIALSSSSQEPPPVASNAVPFGTDVKDRKVEAGNPTTSSKPKALQEQQSPSSEEGVEQFANEIIYLFAESSSSSGSDAATARGVPATAPSGEDGGDRGRGGGGAETHTTGAGTTTSAAAGDAGHVGTGGNGSPSTDESHYSWDNLFG